MGCDIHLNVEVLDTEGKWQYAEAIKDTVGRNYELFAMLAGVRNRFDIVPLAEPRGLPADVSDEVRYSDEYGEHSISFCTVAELLAYDWTQVVGLSGYVPMPEYVRWSRYDQSAGEDPGMYSQNTFGPNIQKIDEEDAEKLLHQVCESLGPDWNWPAVYAELDAKYNHYRVFAKWQSPYYMQVTGFLGRFLPQLWRLGAPDKVRIVFGFDN